MSNGYTHLSPGIWKGPNGKIIKSATDPGVSGGGGGGGGTTPSNDNGTNGGTTVNLGPNGLNNGRPVNPTTPTDNGGTDNTPQPGNPAGEAPPPYNTNVAPKPITPTFVPSRDRPNYQTGGYGLGYQGIAPGGPPGNPPGPVIDSSQLNDAGGAVNTQYQANIDTANNNANLNRVNQSDAYGSATYTKNPDGTYTQNTTLSNPQQQILAGQQGQEVARNDLGTQELGNISKTVSQPLDFSGAAPIPTADAGTRDKVSNDLYKSQMQLIQPRQDQERTDFMQSLADKGIPQGSDLYNKQLQQFNTSQQQERDQVASQATQAGGAEQSRLFDLGQQAHTTGTQDILTQRNQPINEYSQLQGLNHGVTNPNVAPIAQVNQAGVDVTGTAQGYQGLGNQRYSTDVQDANTRDIANLNSETQQFGTAVGANTSRYQADSSRATAQNVAQITGQYGNQQANIAGASAQNVADTSGRYQLASTTAAAEGGLGKTVIELGGTTAPTTDGGTPPKATSSAPPPNRPNTPVVQTLAKRNSNIPTASNNGAVRVSPGVYRRPTQSSILNKNRVLG